MILVDSNVPMYLVGSPHPHKADAQQLLERCIAEGRKLVTDVEVLQEILQHLDVAIGRRDAFQPAFDALLGVVDEVLPVSQGDVQRAKEIALGRPRLSARDALHLAIMEHHEIGAILSFDRAFDHQPGVARVN